MAHFAELDSNNIVKRVLVVDNRDTSDETGAEKEEIGIAFLKGLFGENTIWRQTSYNSKIRNCYAGIGYKYYEEYDAFIGPAPFPSWTLNTETLRWDPPIKEPELLEGQVGFYRWDNEKYEKGFSPWVLETPGLPPAEG